MTHSYKVQPQDKQPPHTGKVENDTNKQGNQLPTQLNQGHRTPESRSDRTDHIGGSSNQNQLRTGRAGQGAKSGPNSRTGRKP